MTGKFHIRNYVRWIGITAAAMVVVGLGIAFLGFAIGGFQINTMLGQSDPEYITQTVNGAKAPVQSIAVKTDMGKIILKQSDTAEYVLEYPSSGYTCTAENGGIVIEGSALQGKRHWYQAVFFNFSYADSITVWVPKNFDGTVELESSFGEISIMDAHTFKNLTIQSDNGGIHTGSLAVNGDVSIHSNFGDIQMDALRATGNIQVKNDNGRTFLKEMTGFATADITSNFGSVEVYNTEGGLLSIQNDNGQVKLHSVTLENLLAVNANFGKIVCDRIFAPDIYLNSDNGEIKGTIEGREEDFDISFVTQMGNGSRAARGNGKYSIEATTAFGSINLDFYEKSNG